MRRLIMHACLFSRRHAALLSDSTCLRTQHIQAYGRGVGVWMDPMRPLHRSLPASGAGRAARKPARNCSAGGSAPSLSTHECVQARHRSCRRVALANNPRARGGGLPSWPHAGGAIDEHGSDLMGTRRARRRTTGRGAASDGSVVGRVAVHSAAGCRLPANCLREDGGIGFGSGS